MAVAADGLVEADALKGPAASEISAADLGELQTAQQAVAAAVELAAAQIL